MSDDTTYTSMEDLLAELDAKWERLRVEGKPSYWKPKTSHRKAKGRRGRKTPDCHHYSRKDVRYIEVYCAWGHCVHFVCPTCREITSGWGPIACPCDHVSGWRGRHVDQQPKPHPAVKAKGRHHDRIKNAEKKYADFDRWLKRWEN